MKTIDLKKVFRTILLVLCLQSCVSKKDIIYLQDSSFFKEDSILYDQVLIQPDDILSIVVSASVPETTIPYNKQSSTQAINVNLEVLKIQGYLVSNYGTIDFPILGRMNAAGKSMNEMKIFIEEELKSGGHITDPVVSIRMLNAKFTVLGEVKLPGTYTYTEENISLLQALGYAGDLTINGKRNNVKVIRERNGKRSIEEIDLTSADWFKSPYYFVKPNDVIVVSPNTAKVKSAGIIGNASTVLTIASLILSSVILITNIK
ncbi:polysaccharide biosynthesis/export family protein [Aquimarina sp. ERC-38]|uniref:polysaccharide biosynthesis/export family protein n=1 Tax=Aquimarina sp. ERC-38 TaxID=2949996 RepID=UPI002247F52A|nr:polysaccharide biosynthesis/export family protein [Aquimarina sp. ERC-38]UZO81456.1 polysaccharide biosynthesis/export family protein [Aquimarina sp. ERC-38]